MKKRVELTTVCPQCNTTFDGLHQYKHKAFAKGPKPDDFYRCQHCFTVLVFKEDMTLRLPTTEELDQFIAKFGVGAGGPQPYVDPRLRVK